MTGQEGMEGGRKAWEEEESKAIGLGGLDHLTLAKGKESSLSFLSELTNRRIFQPVRFGHDPLWVWGSLLSIYPLP